MEYKFFWRRFISILLLVSRRRYCGEGIILGQINQISSLRALEHIAHYSPLDLQEKQHS